jgi:hypothetical protein
MEKMFFCVCVLIHLTKVFFNVEDAPFRPMVHPIEKMIFLNVSNTSSQMCNYQLCKCNAFVNDFLTYGLQVLFFQNQCCRETGGAWSRIILLDPQSRKTTFN